MSVEIVPIEVCRVEAGLEKLLAADAAEWSGAAEAVVPVEPTPIERLHLSQDTIPSFASRSSRPGRCLTSPGHRPFPLTIRACARDSIPGRVRLCLATSTAGEPSREAVPIMGP